MRQWYKGMAMIGMMMRWESVTHDDGEVGNDTGILADAMIAEDKKHEEGKGGDWMMMYQAGEIVYHVTNSVQPMVIICVDDEFYICSWLNPEGLRMEGHFRGIEIKKGDDWMEKLDPEIIKLIHESFEGLKAVHRTQGTVSFKDMLQALEYLAFEVSDKTKEIFTEMQKCK